MDNSNPSGGSGPYSPSKAKAASLPTRPGGHRRGGSEFIGGDGKAGGPGLMSSSPTKGEGALPSPTVTRHTPLSATSAARRGHAHRRSGAISSHDISNILRPSPEMLAVRADSAPTTPSDPENQRIVLPSYDRSISQPVLSSHEPSSLEASAPKGKTSPKGQPRARVGFSDTLEFIPRPRPLSTISSETSSSLSTVRPSHSLSGSISSVMSSGTSSPPSAKKLKSTLDTTFEQDIIRSRPRTADAAMTTFSGKLLFNEPPNTSERPSTAAESSPRAFVGRTSKGDSVLTGEFNFPLAHGKLGASYHGSVSTDVPPSPSPSLPDSESSKRQKNVKSWAESIIPRKGKQRSQKETTIYPWPPTPPLPRLGPSEETSFNDINFDEDPICIIHTPQEDTLSPPTIQPEALNQDRLKLRGSKSVEDIDSFTPMLDLDAALGPFNTPSLGFDGVSVPVGGSAGTKRRMHSSGATGGFSGFGMHYHRRAESAPEMAPINHSTFGLPRLGSNSTMADVFEEEEEDDVTGRSAKNDLSSQDEELKGLGVQIVDTGDTEEGMDARLHTRRAVNGINNEDHQQFYPRIRQEQSTSSLVSEVIPEETSPAEIIGTAEEPRFSVVTKSSEDSNTTPTRSIDLIHQRPSSAPIDSVTPRSGFHVHTPEALSLATPSPDYLHTSFEPSYTGTTVSSVADRPWTSCRTSDAGHDLRVSVDDVPSLTSSASTMISAQHNRFSSSAGTRSSGERSSSLSAAVPARTRTANSSKRASLASLSRLVGSSYGEKSKLSIEDRAQSDISDKPEKKKGKRISRLMHFWKSKEKGAS
ncbi:hypothetical protein MMC20_005652 [Loxospora ochrophaea]|nr:hypothetical protein [Loxospora ochrophaea]